MSVDRLNLTFNRSYFETDLDEMDIRRLIINNKRELGLIYFDENRSPYSYFIVIDGLTEDNEQYRLTLSIKDRTICRDVEISACGSGSIDQLKAWFLHQDDILYSMEASLYARNVLMAMLEEAEQNYGRR